MALPEKRKSGQKPNKTILSRTLFLMVVCGIVAFLILGVKLFSIMIIDHDYYEQLAVDQQTRDTTVTAARGTIYDSGGNILAMSATAYTVFISPYEIEKYDEDESLIASELSRILEVEEADILEKMEDTGSWYKTIKTKIEVDLADEVREFKSENEIIGVHIEEDSKRYYPYGNLACHVVGFVGTDNYGLDGIEAKYDEYLAGTDGSVIRLMDGQGTEMAYSNYEYYYDAVDGHDLELTIDVNIQSIAEKYLEQAMEDYYIQNGGCVIVMDVNTGEILAMANKEDYDLNNYLEVSDKVKEELELIENEDERDEALSAARLDQWRNMAVQDTYEPGSVFKIITLAMGLDSGAVSTDDTFYCGGTLDVLGRDDPLHCWKDAGHDSQSTKLATMNSCNIAFANMGMLVGAKTFYDYVEGFGLFENTGVDLLSEGNSIWWTEDVFEDPNNYSQLTSASFGQTFNVTPMQMITAVSAAVNGGYLVEPHLVNTITDAEGNVVFSHGTNVVNQVISEETSGEVCEILEAVVGEDGGTGSNAYVAGYRIGGKTGTSEKVAQDVAQGEDGIKEYMVSFCGVAPANDPEIAVLVILDNPSHESGIYISGGNMAAPVVGGIFSEILPYMGYEPEYTEDELSLVDVTVPDLEGMTIDEVGAYLEDYGITFRVVGEGDVVTTQLPKAYSEVSVGSQIIVYADATPTEELMAVPDICGLSVSEARYALANYNLYLDTIGASVANSGAVVSKQSIEEGTAVNVGTVIKATLTDTSQLGQY